MSENYTDTTVANLIINTLSKEEYESIQEPSSTELYLTPDASIESTTVRDVWTGTKAQYDAIATKSPTTLYNITDDITPSGGGADLPDQTGHAGQFLTTNGTEPSWASAPFRNIGEIFFSTIPVTDAGAHLLDGSQIVGGGIYNDFVEYIANLYGDGTNIPNYFCTESEWQQSVTAYGVCGKFVYTPSTTYYAWYNTTTYSTVYTTQLTGSGADFKVFTISNGNVTEISHYGANITNNVLYVNIDGAHNVTFERDSSSDTQTTSLIRLPKVTGLIEGTTDVTTLGDLVEAGLPNITGNIGGVRNDSASITPSGAISVVSSAGNFNAGGGLLSNVDFDASRSSSIYGNSSVVQPQTIKVLYYIVIATTTKTDIQVDIDEIATDLNGKADTDLSNVPTSKGILTESYVNGTSWYRVYSDGWCEQGGMATSTGATSTLTLLKPYMNTNYWCMAWLQFNDSGNAHTNYMYTTPLTQSTMQFGSYASGYSHRWQACGYIN